MATSTGPKKADYSRCELDSKNAPSGSEYGSKPHAPQPSKLPLPAGKRDSTGKPASRLT